MNSKQKIFLGQLVFVGYLIAVMRAFGTALINPDFFCSSIVEQGLVYSFVGLIVLCVVLMFIDLGSEK